MKSEKSTDESPEFLNLNDPIRAYRGNPLIGALPPIRTADEILELLLRKVDYDESESNLPRHLRPHAAFNIRRFFLPGIPHTRGVEEVDLLIRQSYVDRNPLDPRYRRILARDVETLKLGRSIPERYLFVPQLGSCASGPPGMGKTLTFDFSLEDMPQVIDHVYTVDGRKIAFRQVVYLKVNLFQDGSLKSFGMEIFERLEEALGQELVRDWGYSTATGNMIQNSFYQVLREYHVGLLIIDEFQFIESSHDGVKASLNYMVRMMNQLGIAVIVIGSSATRALMKGNMAASRRFIGNIPPYTPFTPGESWDAFAKKLLRLRYVKKYGNIEAIKTHLLELSGGIPDLAVKLFLLSQMRLFGRTDETLTAAVLTETSDQLFYLVKDRLTELRGQMPERPRLDEAAKKLRETFAAVAAHEAARVGAAPIPGIEPPVSSPIEINPGAVGDVAKAIRDAAKAPDWLEVLSSLGVVARPT